MKRAVVDRHTDLRGSLAVSGSPAPGGSARLTPEIGVASVRREAGSRDPQRMNVSLHYPDGAMRRRQTRGTMGAPMPLLRRDHDADQTKYRMREKMFSIGDDFWIENQASERAFKVDGTALRLRDMLILQNPSGRELFKVQKKALHVRDTMEIERDGDTVATVKKALVRVVRDRFSVDGDGGADLEAKGNIVEDDALILAVVVCIDQMSHG
jgi:uncharacterized protein YxjI